MAAIIWTDVTALAPELTSVSSGAQTDLLAYVNTALKVSVFDDETGPMTRLARIYLAAHYATISQQGGAGAAGPVTGESAGGLSRQYASFSPMGSDPLFDVTPYGKAFRGLCRRSSARSPVVL